MSRIGKKEITVPKNIEIIINNSQIMVKSAKGILNYHIPSMIRVEINDNKIKLYKKNISKEAQALHGLSRSIIYNMIKGISEGF